MALYPDEFCPQQSQSCNCLLAFYRFEMVLVLLQIIPPEFLVYQVSFVTGLCVWEKLTIWLNLGIFKKKNPLKICILLLFSYLCSKTWIVSKNCCLHFLMYSGKGMTFTLVTLLKKTTLIGEKFETKSSDPRQSLQGQCLVHNGAK